MIKITVLRDDGKLIGFEVLGHAKYDKKGKDIVCAGISAILQTAILGLNKYTKNLSQKINDGFLSFKISQPTEVSEAILHSALLGIKEIQRRYPQCIIVYDG